MIKLLTRTFLGLFVGLSVCSAHAHAIQNEDAAQPSKPNPTKKSSAGKPGGTARDSNNRNRKTDRLPTPPVGTSARGKTKSPRTVKPMFATLNIFAEPPDSSIFIGGIEYRAVDGRFTHMQLQPGRYDVVVRKSGYRQEEYTVNLGAGDSMPLNISLELQTGLLNVTPSVEGTTIVVTNLDTGSRVGTHTDRINGLDVVPGRYEVAVSKNGFRTTTRTVVIKPTETIYLEPPLEAFTPEKPRVRRDGAMTLQSVAEGKFLVVILTGKLDDATAQRGSVDVMVDAKGITQNITGMLPGYPCQVDFVRLENVAEYAFKEAPGVGNQWGRVVVRVRPKDSKRAMRFLINWTTLQPASGKVSLPQSTAASIKQAVAIKRVFPTYPSTAHAARLTGVVIVTLVINERGRVISAKADEGHHVLRAAAEEAAMQWQFTPAHDGNRTVSSTQTIQFNFNL